jgi:hypothetical protein
MEKIITFFKNVPLIHKLMSIFITVIIAVFVSGAYLSGIMDLPRKVELNSLAIEDNSEAIQYLTDQHEFERNLMLRMLCNQDPHETFESCERQYSGIGGGGAF